MAGRLMSDAEIRRRKKLQAGISQTTGALGLGALGGTMLASRGGRNTLRKVPQLKNRIKPPPKKDPDRDRIKGAVTPVLATSAGIGGLGAFNFASYTAAESRKRKQMSVQKSYQPPVEMGFNGEEGHPVELPEIEVPIEKAWQPAASNYDSERNRQKRSKVYEGAALTAAGAGGAGAAHYGMEAVRHGAKAKKALKSTTMHEKLGEERTTRKAHFRTVKSKVDPTKTVKKPVPEKTTVKPIYGEGVKAIKAGPLLKHTKAAGKAGGKAALGLGLVGAAAGTHAAVSRKRKGSWQPYAKRDAVSAFGIDHRLDNANPTS